MAYIVAVDEGHGINTPGKQSPDGTFKEWEFNRAVGEKLKEALVDCGLVVISTNDSVYDTPLSQRVKIANDAKADLFVSVHSNAAGTEGWSTARGIETLVYKKQGDSYKIAQKIQTALIEATGFKDRGVKEGNLYVLKNTKMPAFLAELGFHTNQEEVAVMKTPEYQQTVATAMSEVICQYFAEKNQQETGQLPTIRFGSKGEAVKVAQRALGLPVDGIFGYATEAAVKAFQKKNGLTPDGVVGPNTWKLLYNGYSGQRIPKNMKNK